MEALIEDRSPLAPGRVLSKALVRACEILGLRRADLARMLGVSVAGISRLMRGEREIAPESKEGELALLFLRCFRSLDALLGGRDEDARAWFHAHNHALEACPAELVLSVQGLVDVTSYLDAMRAKA